MKVLVVFESMFGNTELLARSVARGLRENGVHVDVVRAGSVDDSVDDSVDHCDLLVVAAPTHALTMSRPASRADAVDRGAEGAVAVTGVREWIASLDTTAADAPRPLVAVFDTRARTARHWPGSAARAAARALRREGFTVVQRTSFFVDEVEGPLVPGELERAHDWGVDLAAPANLGASG